MDKLCLLGISQSLFRYSDFDKPGRLKYQADGTDPVIFFLKDINKLLTVDSDEHKRHGQLTTKSEKSNDMIRKDENVLINFLISVVCKRSLLSIVFQAVRNGVTSLLCTLGNKRPTVLKLKDTFKAVASGTMRKVGFEF